MLSTAPNVTVKVSRLDDAFPPATHRERLHVSKWISRMSRAGYANQWLAEACTLARWCLGSNYVSALTPVRNRVVPSRECSTDHISAIRFVWYVDATDIREYDGNRSSKTQMPASFLVPCDPNIHSFPTDLFLWYLCRAIDDQIDAYYSSPISRCS